MSFKSMIEAKDRATPSSGYNLVGVDTYEDPGEEIYIIKHFPNRHAAKVHMERLKKDGHDEAMHIYGSKLESEADSEAWNIGKKLGVVWHEVEFTHHDLAVGIKVESEHKDIAKSPRMFAKIALTHLRESPTYYKELAKMESKLKKREGET